MMATAMRLTEDNLVEAADWISDTGIRCDQFLHHINVFSPDRQQYAIARPGDLVVRNNDGSFRVGAS